MSEFDFYSLDWPLVSPPSAIRWAALEEGVVIEEDGRLFRPTKERYDFGQSTTVLHAREVDFRIECLSDGLYFAAYDLKQGRVINFLEDGTMSYAKSLGAEWERVPGISFSPRPLVAGDFLHVRYVLSEQAMVFGLEDAFGTRLAATVPFNLWKPDDKIRFSVDIYNQTYRLH